jgi:signal transduction histidine kinase
MSEHWGGPWRHGPSSRPPPGFGRRFVAAFLTMVLLMVAVPALVGVYVGSRFPTGGPAIAVGIALITVVALLALTLRVFARSFRAARELVDATGRLAEGDYAARVSATGPRTLAAVITSFNRMAERLESEDARRRALLADLGHELRTPLTVLQGRVEALIDGVHPPDEKHLVSLLADVETMERLLEDLRTLSLSQAGALSLHPEPTDIDAMATDLAHAYRSAEIDVRVEGSVGRMVEVDPIRIREVFINLLNNASTALSAGGCIRLVLSEADGQAVFEVIDDGRGIPASELGEVFERYRTGDTRLGSGIGLALSRELVEAHRGTINIDSVEGEGTTVSVSLPFRRGLEP